MEGNIDTVDNFAKAVKERGFSTARVLIVPFIDGPYNLSQIEREIYYNPSKWYYCWVCMNSSGRKGPNLGYSKWANSSNEDKDRELSLLGNLMVERYALLNASRAARKLQQGLYEVYEREGDLANYAKRAPVTISVVDSSLSANAFFKGGSGRTMRDMGVKRVEMLVEKYSGKITGLEKKLGPEKSPKVSELESIE
jgi:hypothetical protein